MSAAFRVLYYMLKKGQRYIQRIVSKCTIALTAFSPFMTSFSRAPNTCLNNHHLLVLFHTVVSLHLTREHKDRLQATHAEIVERLLAELFGAEMREGRHFRAQFLTGGFGRERDDSSVALSQLTSSLHECDSRSSIIVIPFIGL